MKKAQTLGTINGIIAAISYGTNPLFALPMMNARLGVNTVLFYRYFFAVIIYGIFLKYFKKISFSLKKEEFFAVLILALLFSFSSLTLYGAFKYIDSGLACTILFIYPTFVAILSAIFYKEKLSQKMVLAILIISFGIFLLYGGNDGKPLNIKGVGLSLISAMLYAIYMVGVKNFKPIKHIKKDTFNFYIMLFGLLVYVVNSKFCTQIEPINSPIVFICAILIAILPTIISIETINIAIKLIGSTKTALLGALEPISAIVFSLLFFNGSLTFKIFAGVFFILSGVSLVIMKK